MVQATLVAPDGMSDAVAVCGVSGVRSAREMLVHHPWWAVELGQTRLLGIT